MAIEVEVCPGTLKPGFSGYSPRCIREMFEGKTVSHQLPFNLDADQFGLRLEKRKLIPDQSAPTYFAYTFSGTLDRAANAHLTLQLYSQLFDLSVVPSALIFQANGQPALLRKYQPVKMDFAEMAGIDEKNAELNYQYQFSYEGIAQLINQFFPAPIPSKENLFKEILANYLVSYGDAHLKTFRAMEGDGPGDLKLAPITTAYNTALHGDDGDLALLDGLYPRDFDKLSYKTLGYYGYDDFYQFGIRIGLVNFRVKRFMDALLKTYDEVLEMIERSFLSDQGKARYAATFRERHRRLSQSLSGIYAGHV